MSVLDDATGNIVSGALHKIGEGFEWLGTHTRRFVRDDLGFSQRIAQNTGDTVQIAAEIFGPGAAAKGIGAIGRVSKSALKARFGENLSAGYSSKKVATASSSGTSVSKNFTSLDWSSIRILHVKEHSGQNLIKPEHGVFYGDPVKVTNEAWITAQQLKLKPLVINNRDHYIVPRANAGYFGGYSGTRENLNYILLITEHNSNKIITSFPSHKVSGNIKDFWKKNELLGEKL